MEKNAQEYVAFMEGVCDKLGCKKVLPSLKEGFGLYLESIKEGDKPSFEGVSYSYKLNIQEPGKENREFRSGNYDSSDRKRYAKFLSQTAGAFGENAPRFNKPMTMTRKDGISVSLTPMKTEWDDAHYRYGIPKAICEKVAQMIDANGWNIDLDRSGVSYQGHTGHRGIPVAYRGKIDDPAVVAEISNALGPLGFKHEDDWVEAKYGFTGSGPIDTETFHVDVWKYVGKPVEPVNAVQPKQEAISQYEQPTPGNIDRIIRDTNTSKADFVQNIDNIQDAGVRDTIKATDVYKDASRPTYRRKVLKDIEKNPNDYSHFEPEGAPDSDYFANRDGYKSRSEFSKKPDAFHKLSPEVRSHLRHWVSQDGVSPSSIARVLELFPNLTGQDFDNINELAGPRGQYYIEKAAQCYKDHPELKQLMTDMNDRRLDCLWSGNYSGDDPEYRRLTNEIRQIAAEYGVWGTDESGERTAAADADGE